MANLLNANLPSDDEEDDDYVPDEVDEEERRLAKAAKKPKRLRGAAAGAGTDDGDADADEPPRDEVEDPHAALPESKRVAKKAKVDALWSQLNRKPAAAAPSAPAAKPTGGGGGLSLAALCKPKGKSSGDEVRGLCSSCTCRDGCRFRVRNLQGPCIRVHRWHPAHPFMCSHPAPKQAWMRQLGLAPRPKPAAAAVAAGTAAGVAAASGSNAGSSSAAAGAAAASGDAAAADAERRKASAAAALAAVKAATSVAGASRLGTVTVAETRRFAGQTITVNKEVAAGSKAAQQAEAEASAAACKKAGLDAVLASLQQAKKVRARALGGGERAEEPHCGLALASFLMGGS